jgi:hypothetical protein
MDSKYTAGRRKKRRIKFFFLPPTSTCAQGAQSGPGGPGVLASHIDEYRNAGHCPTYGAAGIANP